MATKRKATNGDDISVQAINDLHRRFEMEEKIRQLIHRDNGASCIFVTRHDQVDESDETMVPVESWVRMSLMTRNPKHQEMFTLYTSKRYTSELHCLDDIYAYLDNLKKNPQRQHSYTVKWYKHNANLDAVGPNVSYFYGKDPLEVMERFFENKNRDDYTITSVTMNPIS